MALKIKIHNFEGPFDLLLHLIKKNKMDIYDIKIYEITNQYMEYIKKMKSMDLEITSEFIVMAATLLEIKSRDLLPKVKEEEEDELEQDPKEQLMKKLIEYKKFKRVADFLKEREKQGIMFSKKPEIIEEKDNIDSKELFKGKSLLDLYQIFNKLINTYKNKMNTPDKSYFKKEIILDKFKLEDKINEVINKIKSNKKFTFSELVYKCSYKIEIIITFLAILHLTKLRQVKIIQENNFKEIYIERENNNERNNN